MCLKGFTFHRRVYGPYRLKGPLMRKGWKQWMDDGSPELTSDAKRKYKFDSRFLDDMVRVSWDTAFTYVAKGLIVIGTRYSGEAGARRLREQGYAPEMIEMMKGAGVRTFKHRAGMPVLGIVGKMMNTRFNGGCLPLLDSWIRKVDADKAQGGKYYSNYTWQALFAALNRLRGQRHVDLLPLAADYEAVSYTHLDVYKRQGCTRRPRWPTRW